MNLFYCNLISLHYSKDALLIFHLIKSIVFKVLIKKKVTFVSSFKKKPVVNPITMFISLIV